MSPWEMAPALSDSAAGFDSASAFVESAVNSPTRSLSMSSWEMAPASSDLVAGCGSASAFSSESI